MCPAAPREKHLKAAPSKEPRASLAAMPPSPSSAAAPSTARRASSASIFFLRTTRKSPPSTHTPAASSSPPAAPASPISSTRKSSKSVISLRPSASRACVSASACCNGPPTSHASISNAPSKKNPPTSSPSNSRFSLLWHRHSCLWSWGSPTLLSALCVSANSALILLFRISIFHFLTSSPLMLHQQTSILHHHQPRRPSPLRRPAILNPQLHPQNLRPNPNRRFRHRQHLFRPPKHIHDVYLLRNILQPRVSLLPQNLRLIRIHRNNPISRRLQILRHPVRSPHRIRRQPHHRDRLSALQNLRYRIAACHIFFWKM